MPIAMRAMIASLLAAAWCAPAGAQLLGPTWETEIVLTKTDFDSMLRALDGAVHGRAVGTVAVWRNPTTGHSGTIELMRHFQRLGRPCEQIGNTIRGDTPDVPEQHWVFDSCRLPDGSWKFA